jgi:hypothetical protein
MAHTVLQQSLSEHPGSVCAVRQLSVPLPQFCAMLHGVKASVSEVAMATSAEDSVCTKFIGEVRQDQAVSGGIRQDQSGSGQYRGSEMLSKVRRHTVIGCIKASTNRSSHAS